MATRSIAPIAPPLDGRGRTLALVIPVFLLVILAWLQVNYGGTAPVALGGAILLLYILLCAVRLEAAFLLLLAVAPFSIETAIPGTGAALQLPTEPMLLFAIGTWILRTLARGVPRWHSGAMIRGLLIALAVCIVSMLASRFPAVAAKAIVSASWYALYGLFLAANLDSDSRLKWIIPLWLIPTTILALNSIGHVVVGDFDPTQGYWHAAPWFSEHGSYAAWMSFALVLAAALAVESSGAACFGYGALATLFASQVLLSFTRGAWIGMGVAAIPLLWVWRRRLFNPRGFVVAFGAAAIVAAVALTGPIGAGIEKQGSTVTDPTYTSNLERLNRWYAGWRMFTENPVIGVGYGTYTNHYLNNRRIGLATEQSTMRMGVHSEYLRVLAETGVAGAVAALLCGAILLSIGWRAVRTASSPLRRALAIGASGGLLTYLAHATVNNFIQYDKAAIPVWTSIGLLLAIDRIEGSSGSH